MDLLPEIKHRLEREERTPVELMNALQNMLLGMYIRRKLNTETVVASCVCLLALHDKLGGAKDE